MKVEKIWFNQSLLIPRRQPRVSADTKSKFTKIRGEITRLLEQQRFITFCNLARVQYDTENNCLWLLFGFKAKPESMQTYAARINVRNFSNWQIPTIRVLESLKEESSLHEHPQIAGQVIYSRTRAPNGTGNYTFHVTEGRGASNERHTVIPIHKIKNKTPLEFIIANNLVPNNVPGIEEKLSEFYALIKEEKKKRAGADLPTNELEKMLLEGDYIRANLPILEPSYLTDLGMGLWELYQPTKPPGAGWIEVELGKPWEARNPERDVRNGVVAIDFGTSSTVVACREQGKTRLLRVGIDDFFKTPSEKDYENPTVLEFIHLPNLMSAWQADAYRPFTRWDDIHFSHAALENYRTKQLEHGVVSSLLTSIKQWPLNNKHQEPLRIVDQKTGTEIEIPYVNNPLPNPGEPLTVSSHDSLDPLELYAYYLGLFINQRSYGLFLEYYMTFPVTYSAEVKERIRNAFYRGLQRSLPPSLIQSPAFKGFSVKEEASEPAAYAACALEELKVEPTSQGVPYAVFDFGGGTSDFDFGIFRLPKAEEEAQGYEKVIERIGANGDTYLGGENLIANLAYLVFQDNVETCRNQQTPFVCPVDAELFPGHEGLVDLSNTAQTNSSLLMARLRPLWEEFSWDEKIEASKEPRPRRASDRLGDVLRSVICSDDFDIAGFTHGEDNVETIALDLLDRHRNKVSVTFNIDRDRLNSYLIKRVGRGIKSFFIAMNQAFANLPATPKEIRILLAGNASRSLLVQSLFSALLQDRMEGWIPEATTHQEIMPIANNTLRDLIDCRFLVHRPPIGDPRSPYRPTAKTGVAIGLLKLIPGEPLLATGTWKQQGADAVPFQFFVGGVKKGCFRPALQRGPCDDTWHEIGAPIRGVFILYYTTSASAALGTLKRGDAELKEKSLHIDSAQNEQIFARIYSHDSIEIVSAPSIDHVNEECSYREIINLSQ